MIARGLQLILRGLCLVIVAISAALAGLTTVRAPNTLGPAQSRSTVWHETDPVWRKARSSVVGNLREVQATGREMIAHSFPEAILLRADPARRWVALTFDDGPHPETTPKLLEILRANNVKATFFVVGRMAQQYPDLLRQEAAEGHCLANHTYHHVNLDHLSREDVAAEIQAGAEVVKSITGERPRFFRPPGGDYNTDVAKIAAGLGYTTVLWTDDPGDFARPGPDIITARSVCWASNGAVILLHDGVSQTVEALPGIIYALRASGYDLVTVDQMMARPLVASAAVTAANLSQGPSGRRSTLPHVRNQNP